MFIFGLRSTSVDRLSDPSKKCQPKPPPPKKKQKRPPKSFENEMFIFGLHSTSDDWPSHLSDEW